MRGKLYLINGDTKKFIGDVTDLKITPVDQIEDAKSNVPTITWEPLSNKIVSVFDGKEHHDLNVGKLPTPTETFKRLAAETGCVEFTEDQLCELELTGFIRPRPGKQIAFNTPYTTPKAKLAARRGRRG